MDKRSFENNKGFINWNRIRASEKYQKEQYDLILPPGHNEYFSRYPRFFNEYLPLPNDNFDTWYLKNDDEPKTPELSPEEIEAYIKERKGIDKGFYPAHTHGKVRPGSREEDFLKFSKKWSIPFPVPPEIKYPHPYIIKLLTYPDLMAEMCSPDFDLRKAGEAINNNLPEIPHPDQFTRKDTHSFYRQGDYWCIGEAGNEMQIKDIKGMQYIHFLLSNPDKRINAKIVYHLGVVSINNQERERQEGEEDFKKSNKKDERKNLPESELNQLINKEKKLKLEKDNLDSNSPDYTMMCEAYEKDINETEQQIKQLKEYTKKERYNKKHQKYMVDPSDENARSNVTQAIRAALNKIVKEIPSLKQQLIINTGGDCFYHLPEEISWKLTNDN